MGFVVCMLFLAKSAQFKELGKLSIVPGIFNINELVNFGISVVLNPFMAIPYIFTPVITKLLTYFSIAISTTIWWSNGSLDNTSNNIRFFSWRRKNSNFTSSNYCDFILYVLSIL